jgi:hypothetical protein
MPQGFRVVSKGGPANAASLLSRRSVPLIITPTLITSTHEF